MSSQEYFRSDEIRRLLDAERKASRRYLDAQRLLSRYALERFLYRLGASQYTGQFVLKGALLLAKYLPVEYRSTKDGDLMARGRVTQQQLLAIVQDICVIPHDDGLTMQPRKIEIRLAGTDREYPGYIVIIPTKLGESICDIHLDICFGEAITPPAPLVDYPSLLNLPKPRLYVYPLETVIAEKFQAIVRLGMSNTRLKDFHDLANIADCCEIDGVLLQQALQATFTRRRTKLPIGPPKGLTSSFYEAKSKEADWKRS